MSFYFLSIEIYTHACGLLSHLTMGNLRQWNEHQMLMEKTWLGKSITLSVKWRFETAPYRARRDNDFHGFHLGKRDFDLNSFAYLIISEILILQYSLTVKKRGNEKKEIDQPEKKAIITWEVYFMDHGNESFNIFIVMYHITILLYQHKAK